jgi:hypothetical protein
MGNEASCGRERARQRHPRSVSTVADGPTNHDRRRKMIAQALCTPDALVGRDYLQTRLGRHRNRFHTSAVGVGLYRAVMMQECLCRTPSREGHVCARDRALLRLS